MVLDLGGSRGDLANDIIKGFIHIEDQAKDALIATKTPWSWTALRLYDFGRAYVPDDPDPLGVTDADRDEARKYIR